VIRLPRTPALRAALIQLICYPLTLACVYSLAQSGVGMSYFSVALIQGFFSAVGSWKSGQARWWQAIHVVFPQMVLLASEVELSREVYLGAFLLLLFLYWSTFRTQVPYYPSTEKVWDAIARHLPQDRPLYIVDIGSGLGGMVLDLARRRPESTVAGIELAPLPWLVSRLRLLDGPANARFVRGDYELLDFAQFDVVIAYLSPAAMPALWQKAKNEMRPGTLLCSVEFAIHGQEPSTTIVPPGRGPSVYVWDF
jgi:SAM-dependent methyltransferase